MIASAPASDAFTLCSCRIFSASAVMNRSIPPSMNSVCSVVFLSRSIGGFAATSEFWTSSVTRDAPCSIEANPIAVMYSVFSVAR